jgi:HEAT repeat protein
VALAAALDSDAPAKPPPELAVLSSRLQSRLLAEMAPSVVGTARRRIEGLAASLGLTARAVALTHRRRWWHRLAGAHLLTMYGSDVGPLYRLLDDPHPAVRAQAAEWAGDRGSQGLAQHLVMLLTDPAPLARVTAKDGLLRVGAFATDAIAARLAAGPGPGIDDVLDVAARRPDSRYIGDAAMLSTAPEPSTRAKAAALLGAVGGVVPTDALERLLTDEAAEVRRAAALSLARLGHWPAAVTVAPLLRDQEWDVRHAAAEALVSFGPPGLLLLRRFLHDDDAFARDMAQQALEIADLRSVTNA